MSNFYESWTTLVLKPTLPKDESLWSSLWCLIRTHHNYPLNIWKNIPSSEVITRYFKSYASLRKGFLISVYKWDMQTTRKHLINMATIWRDHIHLGTFLYSSYTKDSKKLKLSSSWNTPLKNPISTPKILNYKFL